MADEETLFDELNWIIDPWKSAAMRKDWEGLAALVGLHEIYLSGQPENSRQLVQDLELLTAQLSDLVMTVGEVSSFRVNGTGGRFSFPIQARWDSPREPERQCLELSVHVGFNISRGVWSPTYCFVNRTPEAADRLESNDVQTPSEKLAGTPVPTEPAFDFGQSPAGLNGIHQVMDTPPLSADSPASGGFAAVAADYFVSTGISGLPVTAADGGKHHLIYVPVVMHADLLRSLVRPE